MADDAAKAGGPQFKIAPGDLKDAAPTFETQSKALKDALDKLKKSLTEDGAPWGSDKSSRRPTTPRTTTCSPRSTSWSRA
ncbi:hypothetical protein ACGF12_06435 [Kitasatospora sp. NPDC048296]|uniref:hypothetical protein n=1 Tax=Kitasatospora sp. NPDC048296 TaxID=3364048 RepID=UPI003712256C